jgi:surface polysaccharide O-acyltransferase-like enzyme
MVWLDNSRIVAIFAVVVLHVASNIVSVSDIGSEYWWIGNFYDSFVRWCVPVFVMISGALLLDPNKKEDLKTFYKKRLSRILVPTLFWSAFYFLWALRLESAKVDPLSLVDLIKIVLGQGHMWFLYMLIGLYLFTPFFRTIVANSTRREIEMLVVFTFLMAVLTRLFSGDSKLFINWFLPYVPYFFLGYLIRTDERDFSKAILWGVFLLSSCLTALGCYTLTVNSDLNTGLYFYKYLSITVIPMSVSIIFLFKSWTNPIFSVNFTRSLSLLTLGVYLTHPVFMDIINHLGLRPLNFYPAISIPVIAIIVFSSSSIGSWFLAQVPYLKRTI